MKSKRPKQKVAAEIPQARGVSGPWLGRDGMILAVILLIGLLLRAWYLWEVVHAPDFAAPQQDPAVQDYHARGIAFGDWTLPPGAATDPEIRTTPYFRPPGHAYFLSAIYFLTRGSYLAPRVVNMILGLASVILMFLLGRSVYGRGVGLVAAFFMATYWGLIFWEGELNDPALFVFLGTALMCVMHRWTTRLHARWAALAGIIVGCYALMRPNILMFGPFLAAWMLWIAWRSAKGEEEEGGKGKRGNAECGMRSAEYGRGASGSGISLSASIPAIPKPETRNPKPVFLRSRQLRRLVASWFVLALMPFLIIVPVTIRNYIMAREFVPISTYFGENFLIGNGPEADGVTPWTPYLQTLEATGNWDVWVYINVVRGVGRELGIPNIKHSEVSRYFYRQTLDYIKDHKLRTLKLMAKKFVLFWTPVEITCNKVVQYEKEYYPPLKYLPGFAMVMALFVLGIALYLLDWKGRRVLEGEGTASVSAGAMSLLFLLFVVVYFVSFLPFFVNGRARVPIIPFCILIGAYGIWRVIQFAAARDYRRTALWAVVFAVLCVLASIQYIRFEPDRSRWHYQRADSYLRLGEVDKAIAEARPLLGQPDTASYMNMRLGRWFAQEGRIEEAFAQFMAALDNHPSDPDVQFNGAAELITIGKVDEGVAHYNEALRLDPNDARAHNNLGFLLEKQRRFNDALNHYREAVRLDPLLAVARNNLGNLLRGFGTKEAMDEAIDNFVKAIEADPKQEDYHYNLAALLAETGRTDKAIERYRIALELNPDDARAHNNLGLLLANREQYDAALQHYHEALRAVPDFVLVYANIGNMLVAQGKFDEGVAMYERGLAINPDDAGLHNGLGYLYAAHGKTDLALREYNEALRIEPDYPLAHNNLGNLLRTLGKTDEAMAHYNRALAIDPRDKRAHFNLAETFAEQGRFDEAIAQYELALASDPANADIPNNLANALVRKVRFDEAIRYYMLALQINPNHAGAHCNLGSVLALRGRREEAIEHFNKALQIDPNNTTAREGLRKLQG